MVKKEGSRVTKECSEGEKERLKVGKKGGEKNTLKTGSRVKEKQVFLVGDKEDPSFWRLIEFLIRV